MSLGKIGFGVILGFGLSEGKEWFQRRQRRDTHWRALKAKIQVCGRLAERFLNDDVAALLYRLPTLSHTHALSPLLADAAVKEPEVHSILLFYTQVDALNRGLAQAERARGDEARVATEHARNRLKAERLVPGGDSSSTYYADAFRVVSDKVH